ncbi:hypothetical protein [Corynebacterium sp. CNCTC7651]|uniref:hypothetical protein n=1 Tax=Corynebacterium sp. CNCTC7651 TaxID=2815361 RepID=UPI001F30E7ED|nr:hypothetical protein [Corynebacterium sp. CNCTC7651]
MSEQANGETPGGNVPQRARVKVRAWHILLLIAAVITCLLLANWQWERYQSGTGTFQNLGYALQWPFFGAFFVYAYRMGIKMENEKIDAINSGDAIADMYEADLARYGADGTRAATEIDEDFLPQRPEIDVETYNEILTPRRQRVADVDETKGRTE